jgi:signal transduction histidine kinase
MNIRRKTFIIIALIALISSITIYYVTASLLTSTVSLAEKNHIAEDMERFHMSLTNELTRLDGVVGDWANWDDTYQFIQDNNTNYVDTNIVLEAFTDLRINTMAFINIDNSIVFTKTYNITNSEEISLNFTQILKNYNFTINQDYAQTNGIIETEKGLMLISYSPILTSNYQGPAKGLVIIGLFVDSNEIHLLENTTKLSISVDDFSQNIPNDAKSIESVLNNKDEVYVSPLNETWNAGYMNLIDINSNPVALLRIVTLRTELIQLNSSLNYLSGATAIMGVILLFSSYFLLEKFILSRLMKMSRSVEKTTINGTNLNHIEVAGKDEVSYLAGKINQMIDTINISQTQLQDYANNLEKKVDEKTLELKETQSKLLRSERLAVIGQMASMVAHDLRSPLSAILNANFFLKMKSNLKEDQSVQKTIKLIDDGLDNANKIVNDLLDYSREIVLEKQKANLKNLVSDSISSSRLTEKTQVINFVDDSIEANIDSYKIKRVIINLINNAIDAMPDGGIIKVQGFANKDGVHLSVADNGKGISKENQNKLWQPLFTTKSKGIGLGLIICKRFVEAHGGQINVESIEGKGTTFLIRLPLPEIRS